MKPPDPLDLFLPPVREWFRTALGEPTPAQRQGWPAIAAGQHTLVLAPTGSGKTLAAFLACLDRLWRQDPIPPGVQVLYVSPLKALNNDIYRNLQVPLAGVAVAADRMAHPLPAIEVGVRTGDTPPAERQRFLRHPPHVLITTPESLHLLLTSRARDGLRGVRYCIVDEIHALCPNKRGAFLALLLERLAALVPHEFVRIGLSATQRPLEEVARFLGGQYETPDGRCVPRPVTVVDAGLRKDLDLRVVSPVERFGPLPERSVWPPIYRLLEREIRAHRSTIVFANNRRTVERITANLNGPDDEGRNPPLARAHHGSVSLEVRRQTEEALKEGRLRAVVATASLELGIDMGAVDLVCQVESPGSVARGLQRVGRAGHLVGRQSKGRLVPKMPADLLEQAVLAREMAAGRVEELRVPINCLDVLAQQIVAMTAMDPWEVPRLHALVRRAYPYRDLTPQALEAVLEMVSGRYRFGTATPSGQTLGALQPRVSWDRTHNRLLPLPGSQQTALLNGGTIPDTGAYAAYTRSGVRIGELDEEFIYERRVGDVFLLGTHAWRLERIEADRVVVVPAEGAPAMVPFWRGEQAGRSYDLGRAVGEFLRELGERLGRPDCQGWLQEEYFLDSASADNLRRYVGRQLEVAGTLPTDTTLLVEAARDPVGDWQVFLLSPLGTRLHLGLRLALEARLRQRLGYQPQCLHHSDGILIRLADAPAPVLDLFDGLTAENVETLILDELADSALFALRFRQNAARALLLPRGKAGRRAPLWLQRLRGRDLLQVARRHPDFPVVAETFRECLEGHLDLPHLKQLLTDVREGRVRVVTRRAESPSPFAGSLVFNFTAAFMYEWDRTEQDGSGRPLLDRELLGQLVSPERRGHLLDPRAVRQVERRLRGLGQPPRSATETAEWLRRLGDLSPADLHGPMEAFLQELEADGRAVRLEVPGCPEPTRWVLAEEADQYRLAFGLPAGDSTPPTAAEPGERQAAAQAILYRFLETHALVGLADVLRRYPFDARWAEQQLAAWAETGRAVVLPPGEEAQPVRWSSPANLGQVERTSLALLRREVMTCGPVQFARFLTDWQGGEAGAGDDPVARLEAILDRLEGFALPAELWEQTVLPSRLPGYEPRWLDACAAGGQWTWVCRRQADGGALAVAFWRREHLPQVAAPAPAEVEAEAARVLEALRVRGASFVSDLARELALTPSAVRAALWALLRRGLVTNDHFDVVRRGEEAVAEAADPQAVTVSPRRRAALARTEGRWSLVAWGQPDVERQAVFQARLLLGRYGVAARELAVADPDLLPWRVLYEVLSRMELAGDVRRGYFVEGMSGTQFALPEATRLLQDVAVAADQVGPARLLHSLDPANLYGSGAPLDVPLLDGGTRPFLRRPGNWLVLRGGRPVLLVESHGRQLTALASASRDDLAAAVGCLAGILAGDRRLQSRGKLTVEQWNGEPVTATAGADLLQAVGFVRDYQALALYGGWR